MDSICIEREVLRKNQKDMLEIKNTVTEIEDIFDGLIIRLDTDEERSSDLKDTSKESPKLKSKENKDWKKKR